VLARQPADVEDVERRGIRQGLVQLPDHLFQVPGHPPRIDSDDFELYPQMTGYRLRVGQVIGRAFLLPTHEVDGETADSRLCLAREGDD
jgi:hypothetical protein